MGEGPRIPNRPGDPQLRGLSFQPSSFVLTIPVVPVVSHCADCKPAYDRIARRQRRQQGRHLGGIRTRLTSLVPGPWIYVVVIPPAPLSPYRLGGAHQRQEKGEWTDPMRSYGHGCLRQRE
jgi:hypothetical protein